MDAAPGEPNYWQRLPGQQWRQLVRVFPKGRLLLARIVVVVLKTKLIAVVVFGWRHVGRKSGVVVELAIDQPEIILVNSGWMLASAFITATGTARPGALMVREGDSRWRDAGGGNAIEPLAHAYGCLHP